MCVILLLALDFKQFLEKCLPIAAKIMLEFLKSLW